MGVQLIFVVETNKKADTDWIYIKETINYFYECSNTQVKLTPVYMDSKDKYKSKEKEIRSLTNQYASTSDTNETKVIYCFDCDDYDIKPEDAAFIRDAEIYCKEHDYRMVWFCKDVERVYLKRKVEDSKKRQEAVKFKNKNLIGSVSVLSLSHDKFKANSSNIMKILDGYLKRKSDVTSK